MNDFIVSSPLPVAITAVLGLALEFIDYSESSGFEGLLLGIKQLGLSLETGAFVVIFFIPRCLVGSIQCRQFITLQLIGDRVTVFFDGFYSG